MTKLKKNEANMHRNYRRLQLHWNKLEWVNTIIKSKRKQPYLVSSIKVLLIKILERIIGLAIQY